MDVAGLYVREAAGSQCRFLLSVVEISLIHASHSWALDVWSGWTIYNVFTPFDPLKGCSRFSLCTSKQVCHTARSRLLGDLWECNGTHRFGRSRLLASIDEIKFSFSFFKHHHFLALILCKSLYDCVIRSSKCALKQFYPCLARASSTSLHFYLKKNISNVLIFIFYK